MSATLTAATHYHPITKTLFELGKCGFCNVTAALAPRLQDSMPSGSKIWGEEKLPAREMFAEDGETICCSVCEGIPYYIENVKSEWAIIHRQTQTVAGMKKSEKGAREACRLLNNPPANDSPLVDVNVAVEGDLTNASTAIRLPGMVVIRLAGDLPNGLKRGTHVQLPIDRLTSLISEIGATPMAKPTDGRKTAKDLIRALIIKKKTDDQIIAEVQAAFPESNADKKHCTKYRRELLVEGLIGADLAAVGSPDHKEWAAANPALAKKGPHAEYHKAAAEAQKAAAVTAKVAPAKPVAKAAPVAKATPKPVAKVAAAKPAAKATPKAASKPTGAAKKPAAKVAAKAAPKAKATTADTLAL